MAAAPRLVVLAHAPRGELLPSAAELLGLAHQLRQGQIQPGQPAQPTQPGQPILALLVGQDMERAAAQLADLGAEQVLWLEGAGLEAYSGPAWVQALAPLLTQSGPVWVLIPHDSQGQDYAPVLSLRLDAACLAGVEGLEWDQQGPVWLRAGLGGKLLRRERVLTPNAVLTVLPGAFAALDAPARPGPPATVQRLTSPARATGTRHLGWREGQSPNQELGAAQTLVAVGRGLGSPDNLPLVRDLAACLGGALAGSRPVCDLGWLDYGQQVGQTGATVAPRLYLACGISGARQHTLGMQGSGFIVAINHDPQAPLHDLADVSVVADLTAFIPALLSACRELK
ncbi:MAG: electron transfer flavoprotein subunit alpha/FixB family protein [Pseudomonadota bacterium]